MPGPSATLLGVLARIQILYMPKYLYRILIPLGLKLNMHTLQFWTVEVLFVACACAGLGTLFKFILARWELWKSNYMMMLAIIFLEVRSMVYYTLPHWGTCSMAVAPWCTLLNSKNQRLFQPSFSCSSASSGLLLTLILLLSMSPAAISHPEYNIHQKLRQYSYTHWYVTGLNSGNIHESLGWT